MTQVIPSDGIQKIAEIVLGKASFESLTLHLYTNDYDPGPGSTSSNFVEASGFGYSAKLLVPANWSIITSGLRAVASYPVLNFVFTGEAGNMYGYWIENASNEIILAERFPTAPVEIKKNGDTIQLNPRIAF